jgi:hypothetical protein
MRLFCFLLRHDDDSTASAGRIRLPAISDHGVVDRSSHEIGGDDRGAALVETALVLVLLVMLLVGTVTAAVAFGRDNSIQNAAREASRFGATLPGPVDTTWLQTVRDVARAAASGDLDTSVSGQFICVAHGDGSAWESLTDTGGVEAEPDAQCFADGRPAGEVRVQVVTQRESTIQAVLFNFDATLSADAAARYER